MYIAVCYCAVVFIGSEDRNIQHQCTGITDSYLPVELNTIISNLFLLLVFILSSQLVSTPGTQTALLFLFFFFKFYSSSKTTSSHSFFFLRQCSYWAQFELVVDRGLQARGREGEHRWLKVFGAEGGGKIIGKKGGGLWGARRGRFRRDGMGGGRGQDLRFKLLQLAHEAEIGRDDVPALLDDVEGRLQPQPLCPHDVGHADCWRARDPRLAVDQDLPP